MLAASRTPVLASFSVTRLAGGAARAAARARGVGDPAVVRERGDAERGELQVRDGTGPLALRDDERVVRPAEHVDAPAVGPAPQGGAGRAAARPSPRRRTR